MKFEKGHKPKNTLPDSHISRRKTGMFFRDNGRWILLHIHNWTKVHGSIPKGYVLKSIDGDIFNCSPDNWKLISRADLLSENRNYQKASASLKTTWVRRKKQRYDSKHKRVQKAK